MVPLLIAPSRSHWARSTERAVHLAPLEVDGNAADGAGGGTDWAALFGGHAGGPQKFVFVADNTYQRRISHSTGSGRAEISEWRHTQPTGNPSARQDELTNAYAAAFTRVAIHPVWALTADVSGDAQLGFWFLQGTVGPITTGPDTGKWSGEYQVGDL
jgi:hypothetical protein